MTDFEKELLKSLDKIARAVESIDRKTHAPLHPSLKRVE